jgi:large subunit ribosomal protein L9
VKLILTAPVDNLGAPGDVVEVKDGYGRNFLIPRGFAIRWTRGGEKQIEGIRRSRSAREIRGLDHAEEVRGQLEELTIDLPARAGDTGKLFGAVTAGDVAAAIKKAGGPSLDKRAVQIAQPIKTVGLHTVGIKLHDAVTAHVRIVVVQADQASNQA